MTRYIIFCTIDPTKLQIFAQLRAEHYGYLISRRKQIVFGGPAKVADGGRPETMVIVVETSQQSEAEAFIQAEPYSRHGGFSQIVIRPFGQVIPELEAGTLERIWREELDKQGKSP